MTLRLKSKHSARYLYCINTVKDLLKQKFSHFIHFWAPILAPLDSDPGCQINTDPHTPDPKHCFELSLTLLSSVGPDESDFAALEKEVRLSSNRAESEHIELNAFILGGYQYVLSLNGWLVTGSFVIRIWIRPDYLW